MAGREEGILAHILGFSGTTAPAASSASASASSSAAAAATKAPSKDGKQDEQGSGGAPGGEEDAALAPLLKAKLKRKLDEFTTDGIVVGELRLLQLDGGACAAPRSQNISIGGKVAKAEGRASPSSSFAKQQESFPAASSSYGPAFLSSATSAQGQGQGQGQGPPAVAEGKAEGTGAGGKGGGVGGSSSSGGVGAVRAAPGKR